MNLSPHVPIEPKRCQRRHCRRWDQSWCFCSWLLHSKMINLSVPDTIDERTINKKKLTEFTTQVGTWALPKGCVFFLRHPSWLLLVPRRRTWTSPWTRPLPSAAMWWISEPLTWKPGSLTWCWASSGRSSRSDCLPTLSSAEMKVGGEKKSWCVLDVAHFDLVWLVKRTGNWTDKKVVSFSQVAIRGTATKKNPICLQGIFLEAAAQK